MTNILIVDDSPTMRHLVRKVLETKDIHVMEAEDGADGLVEFAKLTPDLIISDLNMPQIDGYQMIAAVRKKKKKMELPIIALTTETSSECKQRLRELGANAWISKPFDDKTLLDLVEQHLN